MKTSTIHQQINYWPSMLDLVTSALMIFVLITYFQMTFNIEDLEAFDIREKKEQFKELFNKTFHSELDKKVISYKEKLNFIQITFSDRVLFKRAEYSDKQIKSVGVKLLKKVAHLLVEAKKTGYEQIQVEGHTDNVPIEDRKKYPRNNWELSSARATAVMLLLVQHSRLNPKIFSINGYGKYRPLNSNSTIDERALNRRIEILILWQSPDRG